MIAAAVLAALVIAPSRFLDDFGGTWTCGNANYHERWDIRAFAGHAPLAEVVYGDPAKPDGYAFVYLVPDENVFRYDDFHADGAQAHLTAPIPSNHTWNWTGTYDPIGAATDPNPDIIWTLTSKDTIERHFRKKINGTPVEQGSDICTRSQ